MKRNHSRVRRIALAGSLVLAATSWSAWAQGELDGNRLNAADQEPGNWLTYHGTYKSWHYSPLDQINTRNVTQLREAWSHVASRANRGLQGFPLAIDGILYYSSPYNQVYALDGASGQPVWTYKQKLNEDLVARQTHSPYNRGIAIGYGNIYMGTLDGKLDYFRAHPDVDVLVTDGLLVSGQSTRKIFPPKAERCDDFVETMMQVGWSACSFTLRREQIDLAVFDTELRHLEWTLMALKLARHHKVGFLDEPAYRYYSDTPDSLSKSAAHAVTAPEIWRRLLDEYAGTRYEAAMRRRHGIECHNASWEHARQGNLREAWRLHLRSLAAPGGLRSYLTYSRKLLPGSRP